MLPTLQPAHRAHGEQLVDVLAGRASQGAWAEMDLYEAFDPRTSMVEKTNWARVVSMYVLFVPLLLTWVGLWLAVDAYNALPAAERRARSFFEVWVSGAPSPRFGITASLSELAIGVAAVFLIAIASGMLAERHSARLDKRRDALRCALLSASLALQQRYPRSTADATAALRDLRRAIAASTDAMASLMTSLDSSTRSILDTADARAQAAVGAIDAISEQAARRHTESTEMIERGIAHATGALQHASTAAAGLAQATELDRARREEYDRFVSHLAETVARLRQVVASLHAGEPAEFAGMGVD